MKPKVEALEPPELWKKRIYFFVNTEAFEAFILSLIVINMVIFMMHKPRLPEETEHLFETINMVFLVIFVFEAIFKILCMEWNYFKDPYNVFDFAIISITVGSLLLAWTKIVDLGN